MFFEIEQKHAQRKYGLIVASITAADGGFVFSRRKRQMMRLPMNAAEEFDLNSIDWDVPLY
jgi:hypothetical protein